MSRWFGIRRLETKGRKTHPRRTSGLFFAQPHLSRRDILVATAGLGLSVWLPTPSAIADDRTPQFEGAYKKLVGETPTAEARVKIEMPDLAENGNMVPFSIAVDSPMTDADYVKTITILSTGNPQPVIATFHLTPASGRAAVSGRLRLARTQDVIVVAEMNSGALHWGQANVKVTVGGCGVG